MTAQHIASGHLIASMVKPQSTLGGKEDVTDLTESNQIHNVKRTAKG